MARPRTKQRTEHALGAPVWEDLPLALARLHRELAAGTSALVSFAGPSEAPALGPWSRRRLDDVLLGAGFEVSALELAPAGGGATGGGAAGGGAGRRAGAGQTLVRARVLWLRTLPDTVGPGMRLLICGLNPSLVAADAGYGFAGATNRFWRAAVQAGIVSKARDPLHALVVDRVGMTDLVKRATPRAAEIERPEYRAGAERVARLVEDLRPSAVCFVGLGGWRSAVERRAVPGWQPAGLCGVPAYVMPSTSGLNAHSSLAELAAHLRRSLDPPLV